MSDEGYDFAGWFNASHHGLERRELAQALDAMFQEGDILARWRSRDEPDLIATRAQIERALDVGSLFDEGLFDYGLTAQGGRKGEEAARPDWNRYIYASWLYENGEPTGGEVICADRRRAEEYLLWRENCEVVSSKWEALAPWQATYWKALPLGYRVRYQLGEAKAYPLAPGGREWWKWFDDPA